MKIINQPVSYRVFYKRPFFEDLLGICRKLLDLCKKSKVYCILKSIYYGILYEFRLISYSYRWLKFRRIFKKVKLFQIWRDKEDGTLWVVADVDMGVSGKGVCMVNLEDQKRLSLMSEHTLKKQFIYTGKKAPKE